MNIKDYIGVQEKLNQLNAEIKSHYNTYDEGGDTYYGEDIPEVVVRAKGKELPKALSPKGRKLAKFYASRIQSGEMSPQAIPEGYRNVVNNYLKSTSIEKTARDREGYEGLNEAMMAATSGLPGLLGHFGSKAVDAAVNKATGKESWGQMLYSGDNPYLRVASEITNPGNLLGGIGAARDVTKRYTASSLEKGSNFAERAVAQAKAIQEQRAIDQAVRDIYSSTPASNYVNSSAVEPGMPYSYYNNYYNHLDRASTYLPGSKQVLSLPESKQAVMLPESKQILSLPRSEQPLSLPEVSQPLGLLQEPTAASRRAFDATVEGSTYANNIPKRYMDYVGPEEIYMSPRVTTKLPYRKAGKNLENRRTIPFDAVKLNIADINQAPNIYSFEDLNNIVQKTYDDSYNITRHLAKGKDVRYDKREFSDLVKYITLDKLKRNYPDIPLTERASKFYDDYWKGTTYLPKSEASNNLEEKLKALQKYTNIINRGIDSSESAFKEKQKLLRQVRSLKKLINQYNTNVDKTSIHFYPNIKNLLKKSPQYTEDAEELLKDANRRLTNTEDIEKDVITNLLLQRHRFIRGASLNNDTDEFIRKVFTTIPERNYGGRSDFSEFTFNPHIFDAMYTSNSMGTGIGYSYPRAGEHSRVAIIGKTIDDLDLSGDISTWWDKNKLFEEQPERIFEVNPNKFYLHRAESTRFGKRGMVPITSSVDNFTKQFPGSENLVQSMLNRNWATRSKILKTIENPLVRFSDGDPFSHYLFIGPKGKPIPGYKILKLYDPKKEHIDVDADQVVTRMHDGSYSKGFSKGMKYGGFLKDFN